MIFIDFGLLRSLNCKISYLLAEEHWSHTNLGIWQPAYDSVCKDNSWIRGKCRQRFLSNVYKRFFLFSPRFLRFHVFFLNFHLNVYYIYDVSWNFEQKPRSSTRPSDLEAPGCIGDPASVESLWMSPCYIERSLCTLCVAVKCETHFIFLRATARSA